MKLLNKLKPHHLDKLENLEFTHAKENIDNALKKEYVSQITIGEGMDLCYYVFEIKFTFENLFDYFYTNEK